MILLLKPYFLFILLKKTTNYAKREAGNSTFISFHAIYNIASCEWFWCWHHCMLACICVDFHMQPSSSSSPPPSPNQASSLSLVCVSSLFFLQIRKFQILDLREYCTNKPNTICPKIHTQAYLDASYKKCVRVESTMIITTTATATAFCC